MQSLMLVDGTDLMLWANRRDAQGMLPRVLRRLVHATTKQIVRIGFPAGDAVQLGGWDGVVVVQEGNAYVPGGTSVWEVSTRGDVKAKADEDYAKRCKDPLGVETTDATFVSLTARRWGGKTQWVASRQSEGIWREVRAYDADDLEAWLGLAPAVHIWLSILLGKQPEGAMDLASFWADWSETTHPAVTPEFLLSGRAEVAREVQTWLRDPMGAIALQAESREEALAVFAASLHQLPPEELVMHVSRAVVVRDPTAWFRLTALEPALLLIPRFSDPDAVARAVRAGHRVVVPLGRADSPFATTLKIPRLAGEDAAKALVSAGTPEKPSRELAALARRGLASFRRKLAIRPEVQQPEWARPAEGPALVAIMLAGEWTDTNEADRLAVSTLAGAPYEKVSDTLVRWSNEADPPVRRVGDTWFLVSKEDAWALLARYLTRDHLSRLEQVAGSVLGIPDPRFDLPPDRRWMAAVLMPARGTSQRIRKGIADSLAIMGARGHGVVVSGGVSASDCAARIVRRLLEAANNDWRVWASLSYFLPLLAESAPDVFLEATEIAVRGQNPVLLKLFMDKEDTFHASSEHTGVLWALERLAWSPDYLGRAGFILARLCKLACGTVANQPQDSLRRIFLIWLPQTTATLEQRLRVVDMIRDREPQVAAELLHKLLPRSHDSSHPTSQPQWREWAPESAPGVTDAERDAAVAEVVTRLLDDAGKDPAHWPHLIEALHRVPLHHRDAIVDRLAALDPSELKAAERDALCRSLRNLISRQRSYPNARWSLPLGIVDHLEEIYRGLEPHDLARRYAWLFCESPHLLEGRNTDFQAAQEALAKARLGAVASIHAQAGFPGLLELTQVVTEPYQLGVTLGQSQLLGDREDEVLSQHLASKDNTLAQFARGFSLGRAFSRGGAWVQEKLASMTLPLSSAQRAQLLCCLSPDERAWTIAEQLGVETEEQYWRAVQPYGIGNSGVERAVQKLLQYGRPFSAVMLLAFTLDRKKAVPSVLVAHALECALKGDPKADPPENTFSYHVGELLDLLVESADIEQSRVASLEWAFLPLLGRDERAPKLLQIELGQSPEFFTELLALVFRAESEEPRQLSPDEQARVHNARDLLTSWRTVPGAQEGGVVEAETLRAWVMRARQLAGESGRGPIGDEMIGQVLSGAPPGADGAWPHEAVRDVIETTASADLELGLVIGVHNSRGMVSRGLYDGGAQERELAQRYAASAALVCDRWPRTAAVLRRIADGYSTEGKREDQEAELRQDLES